MPKTLQSNTFLESPLETKEIKPVKPKGNQSWIFIGRTDAETEASIPWPPDVKYWLIGKHPYTGKHWRHEENGVTEDEMVGWYHRFDGHEFEQVLGVCYGQGSLACCSLWGLQRVGHDWATELNWTHSYLYSGKEPTIPVVHDFIVCWLKKFASRKKNRTAWMDILKKKEKSVS